MANRWRDGMGRSLGAAGGATFFLLLGLGAVWFARKVVGVRDGAVLASMVIVPALLYVILRGNLSELRGPGGWGASFVQVARTTVHAGAEKLDAFGDVQIMQKESVEELMNRANALAPDQPVLMTMRLGSDYSSDAVLTYLDTLAQLPRFRLIAILDLSGKFIGCISPAELRGLMQSQELGKAFLDAIGNSNKVEVLRYPSLLTTSIRADATNAHALSVMSTHNLTAIPVVDGNGQLRGVVERERLVSRLVLSLTGGPG